MSTVKNHLKFLVELRGNIKENILETILFSKS